MLEALEIVCTFSRSGIVWDNVVMEFFLFTPEIERTSRQIYAIRDAARADVFDFMSPLRHE